MTPKELFSKLEVRHGSFLSNQLFRWIFMFDWFDTSKGFVILDYFTSGHLESFELVKTTRFEPAVDMDSNLASINSTFVNTHYCLEFKELSPISTTPKAKNWTSHASLEYFIRSFSGSARPFFLGNLFGKSSHFYFLLVFEDPTESYESVCLCQVMALL